MVESVACKPFLNNRILFGDVRALQWTNYYIYAAWIQRNVGISCFVRIKIQHIIQVGYKPISLFYGLHASQPMNTPCSVPIMCCMYICVMQQHTVPNNTIFIKVYTLLATTNTDLLLMHRNYLFVSFKIQVLLFWQSRNKNTIIKYAAKKLVII